VERLRIAFDARFAIGPEPSDTSPCPTVGSVGAKVPEAFVHSGCGVLPVGFPPPAIPLFPIRRHHYRRTMAKGEKRPLSGLCASAASMRTLKALAAPCTLRLAGRALQVSPRTTAGCPEPAVFQSAHSPVGVRAFPETRAHRAANRPGARKGLCSCVTLGLMSQRAISARTAYNCEMALEERCRCRCGGAYHGKRRKTVDRSDPHAAAFFCPCCGAPARPNFHPEGRPFDFKGFDGRS